MGLELLQVFFLSLTLLVTEVIDIFQSCFEYFFSLFNASNDTIHYKINFKNFDTWSPKLVSDHASLSMNYFIIS